MFILDTVIWKQLKLQGISMTDIILERIRLSRRLLDKWGFSEVPIELFRSNLTLGQAASLTTSSKRELKLRLNVYAIATCSPEEFEDTVLHEIAHLIAGPENGHNYKWRIACSKVGAVPQQYADAESFVAPDKRVWKTICTNCGKVTRETYKRRPQKSLDKRTSVCCQATLTQEKRE